MEMSSLRVSISKTLAEIADALARVRNLLEFWEYNSSENTSSLSQGNILLKIVKTRYSNIPVLM
jgi:hypothetical protein